MPSFDTKICDSCEKTVLKFKELERKIHRVFGGSSDQHSYAGKVRNASEINNTNEEHQASSNASGNPKLNKRAKIEPHHTNKQAPTSSSAPKKSEPKKKDSASRYKQPTKEYKTGDPVRYFDKEENDILDAIIVQQKGKFAYELGARGKTVTLNVKDILDPK